MGNSTSKPPSSQRATLTSYSLSSRRANFASRSRSSSNSRNSLSSAESLPAYSERDNIRSTSANEFMAGAIKTVHTIALADKNSNNRAKLKELRVSGTTVATKFLAQEVVKYLNRKLAQNSTNTSALCRIDNASSCLLTEIEPSMEHLMLRKARLTVLLSLVTSIVKIHFEAMGFKVERFRIQCLLTVDESEGAGLINALIILKALDLKDLLNLFLIDWTIA